MLAIVFALHAVPASAQRLEADPTVKVGPVGERVLRAEEAKAAPPPSVDPELSATSLRVVLGGGAGVLIEIGALVGGYGLSNVLCERALGGPLDCGTAVGRTLAFASILAPPLLLMPLTVWGVGSVLGGRAAYWPPLLGGLAGALLSAALIPTGNSDLIPLGLALPVAGALIGFELQHWHRARPLVMPFVVPQGAGVAAVGVF